MGRLSKLLLALGAARLLGILWKLYQAFRKQMNILNNQKNLLSRYGGMNKTWAVVTGGSSGVGFGFCRSLAKRGFDILMIARSEENLVRCCNEIVKEFGVQAEYVVCDVGKVGLEDSAATILLEGVRDKTSDGEIGVLVTAAGNSDLARHFTDHPLSRNRDMLFLNTLGTMSVIQTLMPKLIHRDCRSAVITLGAITAFNGGTPGFATSSANKNYVRALTLAISKEYEGRLDVMCAHPLAVYSNILKSSKDVKFAITADRFAEGILARMGHAEPIRESFGCFNHDLVAALATLVYNISPETFLSFGLSQVQKNSEYLDRPVCFDPIDQKLRLP